MEMKTKLFITGLAFMALTTLAGAQDPGAGQKQQNVTGYGQAYVDANNNGICDNFENGTSNGPKGQRRGNFRGCAMGQKQVSGPGQGQGQGQGPGMGQRGMRQGQGRGRNFVDADKNGVCDFYEKQVKK